MKNALIQTCLALLLAVGLPYLLPLTDEAAGAPAVETQTPPPLEAPMETAAPPQAEQPIPETLLVKTPEGVTELAREEYLIGVVAAEMPASFPLEALKAQAVAARSYALYCRGSGKHPDADVCTDPGCCQAWSSRETLQRNWGESYAELLAKVTAAVDETAGQVLRYGGKPVFAAFHSSSAGATESSGAIWSELAYLVSVPSPETEADVPRYISTVQSSALDFRDTLLSACPEADFTGAPETWLGTLRRDESGRVESVTLGGADFAGTQLRSLFRLRSTAFTLDYADGIFTFTVTGYGHGVGMSQYGAKVMAENGADWREILAHYYPGAELG